MQLVLTTVIKINAQSDLLELEVTCVLSASLGAQNAILITSPHVKIVLLVLIAVLVELAFFVQLVVGPAPQILSAQPVRKATNCKILFALKSVRSLALHAIAIIHAQLAMGDMS